MGYFKRLAGALYGAGLAILGRERDPEGWYSYGSSSFNVGDKNVTYQDLVRWGWYNAWGRACINLRSNAVASLPWRVMDGDRQIDDHPMLKLLGQPEEKTGPLPLVQRAAAHELIGGEAYMLQGSATGGPNSSASLPCETCRMSSICPSRRCACTMPRTKARSASVSASMNGIMCRSQ